MIESVINNQENEQAKAIELLATDNSIFRDKYDLIAFFDVIMHRIVTCYAEEHNIAISSDYRLLYALKEGFKGKDTMFWTDDLPTVHEVLEDVYARTQVKNETGFFDAIDELLANLVGLYATPDYLREVQSDYHAINMIKRAISQDLRQARQKFKVSVQRELTTREALNTYRQTQKQAQVL